MRVRSTLLSSFVVGLGILAISAHAETNFSAISGTLSLGSSGPQITLLQQILNKDPETRVASTGPGSPGQETNLFGSLTRAAVIRFQEKYAADVLSPVGLETGNGRVGAFTRAKLNAVANSATPQTTPLPLAAPSSATASAPSAVDFLVKDSEKVDIFSGDKKMTDVQQKLLAPINSAISSGNTASIVLPPITMTDMPAVVINSITPTTALPGEKITIMGQGFMANSKVYLGSDRVVRSPVRDLSGNLTFTVPPAPPQRYDLVVTAGTAVSNSKSFVIRDPRNPPIRIDSIAPATTTYNGTITIIGSGFAPTNNTIVTPFQTYTGISSKDGKSMSIVIAPERLKTAADVGNKTSNIPVSVSIVNEYGFSEGSKVFTLTL